MHGRYLASAGLAAGITLALFFLMQALIASGVARLADEKAGRIVEFVRLRRDSQVEEKKRELPDRQPPEQPPPPEFDMSDVPKPEAQAIAALQPAFDTALDLAGGPSLGGGGDSDAVPLVRVSPQYPPDAMMRGIEGWVHVSFTITSAGTVKDVEIVEADPVGVFERAAVNAVKRYKYKPKIESGQAVERPGIELVLSFKLKK